MACRVSKIGLSCLEGSHPQFRHGPRTYFKVLMGYASDCLMAYLLVVINDCGVALLSGIQDLILGGRAVFSNKLLAGKY